MIVEILGVGEYNTELPLNSQENDVINFVHSLMREAPDEGTKTEDYCGRDKNYDPVEIGDPDPRQGLYRLTGGTWTREEQGVRVRILIEYAVPAEAADCFNVSNVFVNVEEYGSN
jgi:hypothetical protein